MDSPQRREVHFPRNASPTADATCSATAFPAPMHPQSAPSFHHHPVPDQLYGHAGVVRGGVVSDWHGDMPTFTRTHMPPPVEHTVAQGQPQDLRYIDMGHYGMAHPPLHGHRDHAINYHGVVLDVPSQAQAAPPADIDIFDGPAQNAAVGPAPAFPDGWPSQGPVPNVPANEILRQLAILYLRERNSRVAVIRMEPGDTHGVRVFITLELANL